MFLITNLIRIIHEYEITGDLCLLGICMFTFDSYALNNNVPHDPALKK